MMPIFSSKLWSSRHLRSWPLTSTHGKLLRGCQFKQQPPAGHLPELSRAHPRVIQGNKTAAHMMSGGKHAFHSKPSQSLTLPLANQLTTQAGPITCARGEPHSGTWHPAPLRSVNPLATMLHFWLLHIGHNSYSSIGKCKCDNNV